MNRAKTLTTLLAMGLLAAAPLAGAQDTPPAADTPTPSVAPTPTPEPPPEGARRSGGEVTIGVLGASDVSSSKFEEYREVPEGVFVPSFRLFRTGDRFDFALRAANVRQDDQRYTGRLDAEAFGLAFDYNQVPHNMGNGGRTIHHEVGEGVWALSDTLQASLGGAVDATPTAGRTVAFYDALLGPSFDAAGSYDVSSLRKRGTAVLDLGRKLPFDVTFSYMRELKKGYRGEGGGGVYSAISSVVEVPDPLDEITQEFGVRAEYGFARGNVHAGISRSLYDNRAETLTVDNPFQGVDRPYVTTPVAIGGGTRARWINAPDNEATTGNVGFLLKLARQTRIGGDLNLATWTQDADFYPFTVNTAILTPSGARADALSTLPRPSLDGKINTSTANVTFSSRPVRNLALRAQFRRYDLSNETDRFVVAGDVAGSPDRTWSANTPSADAPFGHATANPYDSTSTRFSGSASYDIGKLTLEGHVRTTKLERTSREATSGRDTGYAVSAVYHASDWLGLRATFDQAERTAEGHTLYGFQSDEAERDTQRVSVDLELSPRDDLDVTLAYLRRHVDFPNRPDRFPVTSGAPTAGGSPFPDTPSGLLEANFDAFTAEVAYRPGERAELSAWYTFEKDVTTNQFSTTTGLNLNNLLNYAGTDETDTFGASGIFRLTPETWTLSVNALRQKVDGFMDVTAREQGTFYNPGRTTLIAAGAGGAQDIDAWDDTTLTTLGARLDYAVADTWTLSAGYVYEEYDFEDAFTAGDLLMPQAVLLFMKSDDGAYDASILYGQLSYRF